MKKRVLLILALSVIVYILKAQPINYSIGSTVDDFTVTDIRGNTHNLSAIANSGKWIILDFFFYNCQPCRDMAPYFSELHEKYGCNSGDLYCLSIDYNDTDAMLFTYETMVSESTSFRAAPSVSGLEGGGNAVISMFGVYLYPTICVIGPDMKLKINQIYPILDITSFEDKFTEIGFSPTPMICNLGISESTTSNEITVYPNPATNNAIVSFWLDDIEDVNVCIFNIVGELMSEYTFQGNNDYNVFEINTENFESGQYLLRVSFGKRNSTQLILNITR